MDPKIRSRTSSRLCTESLLIYSDEKNHEKSIILSPNHLFSQSVSEGFYPKTLRPRSKTGLVRIFSPFNKKLIKTNDNSKLVLDDYLARK